MYHGRRSKFEALDDWGPERICFGPVQFVHCTYGSDLKVQLVGADESVRLGMVEDMMYYDGILYGDWSTYSGEPKEFGVSALTQDKARIPETLWPSKPIEPGRVGFCWWWQQVEFPMQDDERIYREPAMEDSWRDVLLTSDLFRGTPLPGAELWAELETEGDNPCHWAIRCWYGDTSFRIMLMDGTRAQPVYTPALSDAATAQLAGVLHFLSCTLPWFHHELRVTETK